MIPQRESEVQYITNVFKQITKSSVLWSDAIQIDGKNTGSPNPSKISHNHQKNLKNIDFKEPLDHPERVPTQNLSVNILYRPEVLGSKALEEIRKRLHYKPWRFHHKFQIYDSINEKVVAKQEFYELTSDYPLITMSPTHQGPSVIRINLFVRHKLSVMRDFYTNLLSIPPSYSNESFCYFSLMSRGGFEVQLSLKYSNQLNVEPTKQAFLNFKINSLYEKIHSVGAKIEQVFCSDCGIMMTRDPDGNPIFVSGRTPVYPNNVPMSIATRPIMSHQLPVRGAGDSHRHNHSFDLSKTNQNQIRTPPQISKQTSEKKVRTPSTYPRVAHRAQFHRVPMHELYERESGYTGSFETGSSVDTCSSCPSDPMTDTDDGISTDDSVSCKEYVISDMTSDTASVSSHAYSTYSYGSLTYPCCVAYV